MFISGMTVGIQGGPTNGDLTGASTLAFSIEYTVV